MGQARDPESPDPVTLCIEACETAWQVCDALAAHCFQYERDPEYARTVALAADCSDISRLTAKLLMRRTEFAESMCIVCTEACYACAVECRRNDGPYFERAYHACRAAAHACRNVLACSGLAPEEPATEPLH